MKKIYLKPEIESVVMYVMGALCASVTGGPSTTPSNPTDPGTPGGGAPGRKLF